MSYFKEVGEYQSYSHGEADFHFIYNSNSGGGQSFLGGQFINESGKLSSPTVLDGRIGVFCIVIGKENGEKRHILLNDKKGKYEIKPRGEGSTSMKLGVGTTMVSPNKLISTFFMLPPTCTIRTPRNLDISILTSNNYWLQSMWLECRQNDAPSNEVCLMPIDFIYCGGCNKESSENGRFFQLDASKRITDIIDLGEKAELLPESIRQYIKLFADIYCGKAPFEFDKCNEAIIQIMESLSKKFPDKYSGIEDPLPFLMHLAFPTAHEHMLNLTSKNNSLQQIFYGAPGTGKSHSINETTKRIEKETKQNEEEARVFRTTFHPDSDYATFVGCYKPSMESKERLYDKEELISNLSAIKSTGVTYPCHKFAAKYWESLKQLSRDDKKGIISACDFPETMVVEIDKGIVIGEELSHGANQRQIVYRFVAQAFANAYIRAWQTDKPVYLVIEEINRGNCAQIFGDLFQLLDRDENGYSKYPIDADIDFGNYIYEKLQSNHRDNIPDEVLEGKKLSLPSNLYIWASMNTSDQSLFPIDSAFKRRWDWRYMKIINMDKEVTNPYKIIVKGKEYPWWAFVDKINNHIGSSTSSEDKKLGYFFIHREDGKISADDFVSKVLFYLYNDALKDYSVPLKVKKDDELKTASFSDFYNEEGKVLEDKVIEALDDFLKVERKETAEDQQ